MKAAIERLLEVDDFSVFLPDSLDIIEKAGEDIELTRPIGGYCSTERLDRQDEIVVAKGLDFEEFVNFGYFNDNHKQDTSAVLGYPKMARLDKSRWYTEGNLIAGFPAADKVWELAKALKKSKAPRRLGFSIEGKVLERDGKNKIVRAKVRNVAITNCPVNTDCTWDILSKAFSTSENVEQAAQKALSTGGGGMPLTGGAALRQESLETTVHRELHRSGELDFEEAVEKIHKMRPNYSKSTCRRIVRLAMCR
jgi:hypothetical protein